MMSFRLDYDTRLFLFPESELWTLFGLAKGKLVEAPALSRVEVSSYAATT